MVQNVSAKRDGNGQMMAFLPGFFDPNTYFQSFKIFLTMQTIDIFFPDNSFLTFKIDTTLNRCKHLYANGSVQQLLSEKTGEAHEQAKKLQGSGLEYHETQKAIFEYLKAKKGKTPKW